MYVNISVELSHTCPIDDIIEHATALEKNGFYRVWVPDTVVSQWEAWVTAGSIMHCTNRIKIGVGVMNPYTRHPVVAAQMAATMQRNSGGRLSLSIGKGVDRFLDKAGIEQHSSAVEEYITILRELISGNRTEFSGKAYNIDGMRLRTIPPEDSVPIYFAAIGFESWKTAVAVADGIATIWNDKAAENRKRSMVEQTLPTAALIPFSLSPGDYFWNKASSLEELRDRIDELEKADFDEVIVAYKDMKDLEMAARLI